MVLAWSSTDLIAGPRAGAADRRPARAVAVKAVSAGAAPADYETYDVAATAAPATRLRPARRTLVGFATVRPANAPVRGGSPLVPEYDSYAVAEDPERTDRFLRAG